jgi:hypothetical protein
MDFKQVRNGVFAIGLGLAMNVAQAMPILGVLEFAGVYNPQLQGVTGFNKVIVNYATGDFASWLTYAQTTDMSGVNLATYPASWSVGGVSINLLNSLIVDDGDLPIDLAGLGLVNYQGYDQTNISWSFSETPLKATKSAFTFRLETIRPVDPPPPVEVSEPSSLGLVAIGLMACGFLRRRMK